MIETDRIGAIAPTPTDLVEALDLVRIVVAVDPAGSSRTQADETAIIVAGRATDGHLYVLDDRSGHYTPLRLGHRRQPRRRRLATPTPSSPKPTSAARWSPPSSASPDTTGGSSPSTPNAAKAVRAEPVVGLYEQHLVHHVGIFPELEDQLISWVPYTAPTPPTGSTPSSTPSPPGSPAPTVVDIATPVRAHVTDRDHGRVTTVATPRQRADPTHLPRTIRHAD